MARTPRSKPKKQNTKACIDLGDLHPHVKEISKSFDLSITATIKLLLRRSLGLEHVVGGPFLSTSGFITAARTPVLDDLPTIPHGLPNWSNDLTTNQAFGSNPASDI